ncbi:hypothetical protein MLC35_05245 [Sulfurimonas sp. NW7]|uniref:hypothetical protein n=1 Tax=Sulfurimonas sp. NW7 TaxID=2922727 RepID=UPI003DA9E1B8
MQRITNRQKEIQEEISNIKAEAKDLEYMLKNDLFEENEMRDFVQKRLNKMQHLLEFFEPEFYDNMTKEKNYETNTTPKIA